MTHVKKQVKHKSWATTTAYAIMCCNFLLYMSLHWTQLQLVVETTLLCLLQNSILVLMTISSISIL